MLIFAAELFLEMFKGHFKEAVESSVEFPDDDSDARKFLIEWCYEGRLPSITPPRPDKMFNEEDTTTC
jgi:hypothetical protein